MASLILLVPLLIMATTAALSVLQRIVAPCQFLPQSAHARMMGRSSFTVMWTGDQTCGHGN